MALVRQALETRGLVPEVVCKPERKHASNSGYNTLKLISITALYEQTDIDVAMGRVSRVRLKQSLLHYSLPATFDRCRGNKNFHVMQPSIVFGC